MIPDQDPHEALNGCRGVLYSCLMAIVFYGLVGLLSFALYRVVAALAGLP